MPESNHDHEHTIAALEDKYLLGQPLSPVDLGIAQQTLASESLRVASISCGAILRSEPADYVLKNQAFARLEDLCTRYRDREHQHRNEILVTLLLIPLGLLQGNIAFRAFVHKAAVASRFTTRADAMLVLERLARCGDTTSVDLLNTALEDTNEVVRRNARTCLSRLANE